MNVTRDQVIHLYRTILGRDPYPDELAPGGWVDRHVKSGLNLAQLTKTFQNSEEAKTRANVTQVGSTAPESDNLNPYKKWYAEVASTAPKAPPAFNYSPEQAAADQRTAEQTYRPYYQEQASQSGQDFTKSLLAAREGFSRRGLWGAAGGVGQTTDPTTGLAYTAATAPTNTGGPVSGLRQVGEANLNTTNERANTAFGRAYTQNVVLGNSGTQALRNQAQDVYQKTIMDPYEQAYASWQNMLTKMQPGVK